jgi:uncharacterized protein YeaO (DUF488 family)
MPPSFDHVHRDGVTGTMALCHSPSCTRRRGIRPRSPDDGARDLVDRLWPRGLGKENAPSNELRSWYGYGAARFEACAGRYRSELEGPARAAAFETLQDAAVARPSRFSRRRRRSSSATRWCWPPCSPKRTNRPAERVGRCPTRSRPHSARRRTATSSATRRAACPSPAHCRPCDPGISKTAPRSEPRPP